MTDDMTRTEIALLLSLGTAAVAHAGRLAAELRYREVGADEMGAIGLHIEDTLTHVIVGLRVPGPGPTLDDVAELMREAAMGAVLAILGEPPAAVQH